VRRRKNKARNVFSRDCPKRNSCGYLNSRVVMDKSLLDRHSIQHFYRYTILSERFHRENLVYTLYTSCIKLSPSLHNFYHRHHHHYIFFCLIMLIQYNVNKIFVLLTSLKFEGMDKDKKILFFK
jgi:hypothetical protein